MLLVLFHHHHDEEDSASVPTAEPRDPPIIDTIAERHRLAKPKELCLNVHGHLRPHTSMARQARTVKVAVGEAPEVAAPFSSALRLAFESQIDGDNDN
jgi:hypothetical protein